MNKKMVVVLVLALLVVSGVFATGIGIQGGYSKINKGNGAVTFKLDSLPFVFAANFDSYYGGIDVGATADLWFVNNNLTGFLNYYVGAGAGATISLWNNYYYGGSSLGAGAAARLPIGVNAFFLEGFLEPYFQLVPQLYVGLLPKINLDFDISGELGLRIWF